MDLTIGCDPVVYKSVVLYQQKIYYTCNLQVSHKIIRGVSNIEITIWAQTRKMAKLVFASPRQKLLETLIFSSRLLIGRSIYFLIILMT